jgi:hypothetical protein
MPAEYQAANAGHSPDRLSQSPDAPNDSGGGGPDESTEVNPPAAGQFVDLNATRCSSALLLHNRPPGGRAASGGGGGLPICDSRQYPLQLANRTLVLLPAGGGPGPEDHWFWDLFLAPDMTAAAATVRASHCPPLLQLLLVTQVLLLARGYHSSCCCCGSSVS